MEKLGSSLKVSDEGLVMRVCVCVVCAIHINQSDLNLTRLPIRYVRGLVDTTVIIIVSEGHLQKAPTRA